MCIAVTNVLAGNDIVELRNNITPWEDGPNYVEGQILIISEAGVQIRTNDGPYTHMWLSWDQIRNIKTDHDDFAKQYIQHQTMAKQLWRARLRVEREDYALAEPILETLYPDAIGRTDETALVILEGILRCRLARNAREAAVIPWLETSRILRLHVERTAYIRLPDVLDAETWLCPALPPVWIQRPALSVLRKDLSTYVVADSPITDRLALLYLASTQLQNANNNRIAPIQFSHDIIIQPANSRANTKDNINQSDAVAFVEALVICQSDDFQDRRTGISKITPWIRHNGWMAGWARYGRGIAQIRSTQQELIKRGLVDLLYLPSEFAETNPYLAGIALYQAAYNLESAGKTTQANKLKQELNTKYQTHPITQ